MCREPYLPHEGGARRSVLAVTSTIFAAAMGTIFLQVNRDDSGLKEP